MNRAAFLDRDGVLNHAIIRNGAAHSPERFSDFEILPEAGQCVTALRRAGLLAIVVTNQPGIGSGLLPCEELDAMHHALREAVLVDDIFVCPHIDADGCECRKPKKGLLLEAGEKWDIDFANSFLIGDRWRDIGAGQAVGCYTVLIERPYSGNVSQDYRANSLMDATDHVLGVTLLGR